MNWRMDVYGNNNEETLKAIPVIGDSYFGLRQLAEAKIYLTQAVDGYTIVHGHINEAVAVSKDRNALED